MKRDSLTKFRLLRTVTPALVSDRMYNIRLRFWFFVYNALNYSLRADLQSRVARMAFPGYDDRHGRLS